MAAGILDSYVLSIPSAQNALDIFRGEWSSKFPPPFGHLVAGPLQLFQDPRVEWALSVLGGVANKTVLELGPLEGGHSYMLERGGAARVTAIEANTRSFLKCLITKELLGLQRCHFLCGDFVHYLRESRETFDVCFASGVLYHMLDPVELLASLSLHTDRLFIWTHYYDDELISNNQALRPKFSPGTPHSTAGFEHTLFRQEYLTALEWSGFCGGGRAHSHWMTRADILAALKFLGFKEIITACDEPAHQNGPAFCIAATK
jgi:hypothetical protein